MSIISNSRQSKTAMACSLVVWGGKSNCSCHDLSSLLERCLLLFPSFNNFLELLEEEDPFLGLDTLRWLRVSREDDVLPGLEKACINAFRRLGRRCLFESGVRGVSSKLLHPLNEDEESEALCAMDNSSSYKWHKYSSGVEWVPACLWNYHSVLSSRNG